MRTIQMTIEEELLEAVDRMTAELSTTRSAFIREALQVALRRYTTAALEQQHARGYAAHPVEEEELNRWAAEQVWGQE
jgi:metal-responsive CopG/Arc/MetJ family transcriptional regulator